MFGTPDRDTGNAGIYLGTITRVDGATAYVEVPRLAPGYEYPARFPAELKAGGAPGTTSAAAGHSHGVTVNAAGGHSHGYTDDGVGASTDGAGSHAHAATAATGGGHTHTLPPAAPALAKDDAVAVAFLEGGRDELVVLIRLA